ncbi:hypothetical protein PBI_MINERVA_145 [Mycobacterium phage Minerva]|uniref:hypothetical protein n=1 Tax=Mycobacterium phage Wanda TaxID=1340713 RepID=UPI0003881AAC|nr:hypothetical protein N857_gp145 [Mycobacterium phage Wanda]YP_009124098.1 hypothetical protein VC71_gp145 [Mycobacterium phage Minerva]AGT11849.1 hypothetical protein PBI_WANDA_145 [Mycobacterium phage Wanda]AIK69354.1 hypothetical protein PBI_MINERVA_145 [Mycobacterium phage Minerva]AXQ62547.1 hypothetical protein SEA_ZELINK_140 [Mycobacterium phage Zelink]
MSDPVVEAVLRAIPPLCDGHQPTALMAAAAREVLKPIRELVEKLRLATEGRQPFTDPSPIDSDYDVGHAFDDGALCLLALLDPLIYSSEELQ